APFPSRSYMAGVRVFPSLLNELSGATQAAWAGLTAFDRPFLTLWADNDPEQMGSCAAQQELMASVPGAAGQAHHRLARASHFLSEDQGPEIAQHLLEFFAADSLQLVGGGARYCQIMLSHAVDTQLTTEVWSTLGLSDCPAESLHALDVETIQSETGALRAAMNGPHYQLPFATGAQTFSERQTFGDLELYKAGTLTVDTIDNDNTPYTEDRIQRTVSYIYPDGSEIYELIAPDGAVYVMQAWSQMVDESLSLSDLPDLGTRLALPAGWRYRVRTLDSPLVLSVAGEVFVIQDELGNSYLRR
ncbi:MAG: hypothetical protein AAGC55_10800, partial [Myxococcota bacterium]